jgi:signal transduction histidine kinase
MNKAVEILAREGLPFFGKVNATISHELNNIVANISETVGLMNDLLDLADKGEKLDEETVKSCGAEIADEVRRFAFTVKQMNAFSHSVDKPFERVVLSEILDLAINLFRFLREDSQVAIDLTRDTDLKVTTRPFLLLRLVYQVLMVSCKSVSAHGSIRISICPEDHGARIVIANVKPSKMTDLSNENMDRIVEVLGAKLYSSKPDKEYNILLPYNYQ